MGNVFARRKDVTNPFLGGVRLFPLWGTDGCTVANCFIGVLAGAGMNT